jgi:hypothetical protein
METVPYKQLEQLWADVCGIESDALLDLDRARFNHAFNRLIRRAWNWHRWPALHLLEERRYRPIWMAQAYEIDEEVYHEATEAYYLALDTTAASDEPGTSVLWEEMADEDVEAYVAYEQEGETGFSLVTEVWDKNFRTDPTAVKLRWEYDDRGVRLLDTASLPASVWLYIYTRCPRWAGADWSASSTYAAGKVLYFTSDEQDFEGDFWLVLDTTAAAESPFTTPAKFSRLEIPDFMGDFIVAGARIAHLKGEGQLDKALAESGSEIWDTIIEERIKLLSGSAAPRRARVANI